MANQQNTKFLIKSLGCKVSQYDGERLAEKLRSRGFVQTDNSPDLYILNGCSVTGRASQKVRQALRSAAKSWPGVKTVLAGCEARLVKLRNQEIPEAEWLLPYTDDEAVDAMISALGLDIQPAGLEGYLLPITAKTRAYLKVQDGCSQFCSYCIVAHLRGKEWSRPIEDAVEEARQLVAEGHKELVLTGIHVGHFRPSLVDLFEELEKIEDLSRIRLSSIESVEINDRLLGWFERSPKACHHFHVPLQSGCDSILKAMRRPYLTADFRRVVSDIRQRMPDAAVSTDLIVGFPGETEEYFQETLNFLEEMKFSRIHIFKYSPRDGTPAAVMPDQIDNAEKARRSDRVEAVWKKTAAAFYNDFVGREIEVLWETHEDGMMQGLSREYIPCFLKTDDLSLKNTISFVKGVSADFNGLVCE